MTTAELQALPATVNVATAARALGFGRTLAYDLARRDEFPCRLLRIGCRYHVLTSDLLAVLGIPPDTTADNGPTPTSTDPTPAS